MRLGKCGLGHGYGVRRLASKGLWLLVLTIFCAAGAAQAQLTRVAVLGDSLVAGFGLPVEQGFVPVMQTALGDQVVLVNAGVSGDTTAGGLARLDWTLAEDVDGLVVVLGGNDFLRGIDPANTRANLEAIVSGASARGLPVLLIPMQAPGNFGADYKAEFDAIYGDLIVDYGLTDAPNFLAGVRPENATAQQVLALLQPDGLHPNAEGVRRVVEALRPSFARFIAVK